jgi:hypothetical protein
MAANRPRSLQIYDPVLSNLARAYRPYGLIARDILPSIPTKKLSGQYPVFPKSWWFRAQTDNKVTDRAPAREVDFEWSLDSYLAEEYALKVSITDLEREQADEALHLERGKTELLTGQMELAHEIRVAALLDIISRGGGLSNTNSDTPSVKWDQDTATIEADIKDAQISLYRKIGRPGNTLVIPYEVAYAMAVQEDIRELLRYDASGRPSNVLSVGDGRVLPAQIHGARIVIPMGAQMDEAREGGTEDIAEIWGNKVRLLYSDKNAKWGIPSVAYEFRHTAKKVTRWRETDPDLEYIREMERYDLKVVAEDAGYVIEAPLT